jgi:hypothetical protein
VGLKVNGTCQFIVYADDMNLHGENIGTIKKNTVIVIDASKEDGPEINADNTKYMLLFCLQKAGLNHDIKAINISDIWGEQKQIQI